VTADPFAMVPRSLICSGLDPTCLRLFAFLDSRQGIRGFPHRGLGVAADALGVQERTLGDHAKHLVDFGVIEMTTDETKPGQGVKVFRVIHNPARKGGANPNHKVPPVKPVARKQSNLTSLLDKKSDPRPEPVDQVLPPRLPADLSADRGALNAPEAGALSAPSKVRSPRSGGVSRGAPDAPRSLSPRSEKLSPPIEQGIDVGDGGQGVPTARVEEVVRGRCCMCHETERWLMFLEDGVELRICDFHVLWAKRTYPSGEVVDLFLQGEELERPFVVPPVGATQAAVDLLLGAFPGAEVLVS